MVQDSWAQYLDPLGELVLGSNGGDVVVDDGVLGEGSFSSRDEGEGRFDSSAWRVAAAALPKIVSSLF